jgi:hypothetical protein
VIVPIVLQMGVGVDEGVGIGVVDTVGVGVGMPGDDEHPTSKDNSKTIFIKSIYRNDIWYITNMRCSFLFIAIAILFSSMSLQHKHHPLLKVGIIDTGLDLTDSRLNSFLCKGDSHDFITNSNVLNDLIGHGTVVAGLIVANAPADGWCYMILHYYSESSDAKTNVDSSLKAMKWAISHGAKIINYSAGGPYFSEEEYLLIRDNPTVTFVAAAGNEHENIDMPGNEYYPASYSLPNIIAVGALGRSDPASLAYWKG